METKSLVTQQEIIKDDSQTKRTSLTERFAAMVSMNPNDEEDATKQPTKTKP